MRARARRVMPTAGSGRSGARRPGRGQERRRLGAACFLLLLLAADRPAAAEDGLGGFDRGYVEFLLGAPAPFEGGSVPRDDGNAPTRERVRLSSAEPVGTILIDTKARRLFLVDGEGTALRYLVGVGREGFGWRGVETISAKRRWPDWRPPADMLARRPDLPRRMPGGPDNPLGAGALYLGSTLYRIHGSNEPESVGEAASSGCFRMRNADIVDLYERVRVGGRVVVF